MLAIRLQRVGRKGHAQYRVVVQDSRFSPKSGRIVAYVGNYNPHAKTAVLEGEKISVYLKNGAQPSERVAQLLKQEGIKLPSWVEKPAKKKRAIRNPSKLRRNRPAEEPAPTAPVAEAPVETPPGEENLPAEPDQPAEGAPEAQPEEPAQPEEAPAAEEPKADEQPQPEETPQEEAAPSEEPDPKTK